MKNYKLKNLNDVEMREISGGSEITDSIWDGIGATGRFIYEFYKSGPVRPSQYR